MKQSEELQGTISKLEAEIEKLEADAKDLLPAAHDELSKVTRDWINKQVGETMERNPSKADLLDANQLQALKQAVDAMPTHATDWMRKSQLLPEQNNEDFFDNAFRTMTGHLGAVLSRYGFVDLRASDSLWLQKAGLWSFRTGPYLRDMTIPAINKVRSAEKALVTAREKAEKLQLALKGAKAKERWESL
jgi:hypothetical protein